ncbi:MAG: hypothetical protein CSA25_03205 [Desulfobacter postgatei]|uniref:Uncharacterized protein n=1 Tax=Desulfobacter postgatei TaxID=2293 RepID=A0A2G6MSF7_9BACT|nr:MAG: hypothetical protein CSA25_03205 [Desulfobacter postgatei]
MEYRFDIDKVRTTILTIDPFEFPEKLPELIGLIDSYSVFLTKAYNTTLEISRRLGAKQYFNYSVWAFMTAGPAFIAAEQQDADQGLEWQFNFLNALSRIVLENMNKVLAAPLVPGNFPEHWVVSLD